MTDVDVELARSAQLVARARRQSAVATVVGAVVGLGLVVAWVFFFTAMLEHENPLNWPAALVAPVLFFGSIWLSERTATALTSRHEETL